MPERGGYGEVEVCVSGRILQNSPKAVERLCLWIFPQSRCTGCLGRASVKCVDGISHFEESSCTDFGDHDSPSVSKVYDGRNQEPSNGTTEARREDCLSIGCFFTLHRARGGTGRTA